MSILKNYKYLLEGLDCANCAKKIEDKIAATEGYEDVNVNFSTLKLSFKTNYESPKKEIIEIIKKIEPDVNVLEIEEKKEEKQKTNYDILRLIIGIV